MSIVDIEAAIEQLWDEQLADDLDTGRLDFLLQEVKIEYEISMAAPLPRLKD